jgi:hypothetical protein
MFEGAELMLIFIPKFQDAGMEWKSQTIMQL